MGLKELAISKAPENEWRARSIWKTEKKTESKPKIFGK